MICFNSHYAIDELIFSLAALGANDENNSENIAFNAIIENNKYKIIFNLTKNNITK